MTVALVIIAFVVGLLVAVGLLFHVFANAKPRFPW